MYVYTYVCMYVYVYIYIYIYIYRSGTRGVAGRRKGELGREWGEGVFGLFGITRISLFFGGGRTRAGRGESRRRAETISKIDKNKHKTKNKNTFTAL
jgi:hypothetical protein